MPYKTDGINSTVCKKMVNFATTPAIVVGDLKPSDSDEQVEKWICLERVTLDLNDKAILLGEHCLTDTCHLLKRF